MFQDMLLGINAHINYDLAYGIYLNFREFDDGREHLLLPRRKFDHDRVNNILVDCIPAIEATLTRDYGAEVKVLSELAGGLDEVLGEAGLKYYRERVWWSATAYYYVVTSDVAPRKPLRAPSPRLEPRRTPSPSPRRRGGFL